MKITFRIAFRNLIRQKRRNILLGAGIAFGIMILFISQSYTKGLSDILINSFISNIYGHIQINVTEKSDRSISIIRDKNDVVKTINETIKNVSYCRESISTLTRVIGNGSGALMLIVGIEKNNRGFLNTLKVIDGDISQFTDEAADPAIILYSPKAEELNVKAGDTVNIKMTTIYGQVQSARMTVAAIVEPKNIFLNMAGFTSIETIKSLMGYRPHETSRINIVLDHISKPEETVVNANLLHKAFKPAPVFFQLSLFNNHTEASAIAAGLNKRPDNQALFESELNLPADVYNNFSGNQVAVIIGSKLAKKLGATINSRVKLRYESKYEGLSSPDTEFTIAGIIDETSGLYADSAFFNAPVFRTFYLNALPLNIASEDLYKKLMGRDRLMTTVMFDKKLLNRPADSREWKKLQRYVAKYRAPESLMYITSMKETAEDVLKIESALNMISLTTVLILFAIILTGSVNALRMTIRERTREIGTVRSIGMQKKQVVRIFVIESALLTLLASASGVVAAIIIITFLSGITFEVDTLFSILIDNGHLHFLPEFKTALTDIIIAIFVTVFITWFPAKKAAAMSVTKALRHYE